MDNDSLGEIIKMHIKECDARDERNTRAISEIKGMFSGIWNAHDEMRKALTSLQIRAAFAVGAVMVAGKVFDYAVAWLHQ
ncbi:hypothetical protein BH10PLA2_BH10PLA2_00810 [soil metagenome]